MRLELANLMTEQQGVFRRRQAVAAGYSRPDVERFIRNDSWVPVRHGIYTTADRLASAATSVREAHLLAAAARRLAVGGDTVVSHESAACFHRIDLLDPLPTEPRLTLHRPAGAGRMTAHGLYVAQVPPEHRLPGGRVTTAARGVADCARTLELDAAFVTVESALRLGLDRRSIIRVLSACSGWPGANQARDLVMLADPWSESALESLARLWFVAQGLPRPFQQRNVLRLDGRFVARVDFVWPQFRTVCEVDGRVKYEDPIGPADATRKANPLWRVTYDDTISPAGSSRKDNPLWREKLREDDVRDLGLEVARGTWRDRADEGAALAARLRRAFVRGQRAVGEPAYQLVAPQLPRWQPLAAAS